MQQSFNSINDTLLRRANGHKKTSPRYASIDTAMVVERVLMAAGVAGMVPVGLPRISAGRGRSTRHTVRIRFSGPDSGPAVSKEGFPELVIKNSYNGESSLSFHLGLYRLICSNGLTIAVPGADAHNLSQITRHLEGPSREFHKNLDYQIAAAFEGLKTLGDTITRLENTPVTALTELYLTASLGLSKRQNELYSSIRVGTYGRDTDMSLWAVFNAINETYRRTSRSESANESRNIGLLERIESNLVIGIAA